METKVRVNPSYDWSEEARQLGISNRELEVFALVVEGFTNREVAEILHIKHQSVSNHMHRFTRKLGVKGNAQALLIALHMNLVKAEGRIGGRTGEIRAEGMLKRFRDLFDGKAFIEGVGEKEKRKIKVWLLSHGIDVDSVVDKK